MYLGNSGPNFQSNSTPSSQWAVNPSQSSSQTYQAKESSWWQSKTATSWLTAPAPAQQNWQTQSDMQSWNNGGKGQPKGKKGKGKGPPKGKKKGDAAKGQWNQGKSSGGTWQEGKSNQWGGKNSSQWQPSPWQNMGSAQNSNSWQKGQPPAAKGAAKGPPSKLPNRTDEDEPEHDHEQEEEEEDGVEKANANNQEEVNRGTYNAPSTQLSFRKVDPEKEAALRREWDEWEAEGEEVYAPRQYDGQVELRETDWNEMQGELDAQLGLNNNTYDANGYANNDWEQVEEEEIDYAKPVEEEIDWRAENNEQAPWRQQRQQRQQKEAVKPDLSMKMKSVEVLTQMPYPMVKEAVTPSQNRGPVPTNQQLQQRAAMSIALKQQCNALALDLQSAGSRRISAEQRSAMVKRMEGLKHQISNLDRPFEANGPAPNRPFEPIAPPKWNPNAGRGNANGYPNARPISIAGALSGGRGTPNNFSGRESRSTTPNSNKSTKFRPTAPKKSNPQENQYEEKMFSTPLHKGEIIEELKTFILPPIVCSDMEDEVECGEKGCVRRWKNNSSKHGAYRPRRAFDEDDNEGFEWTDYDNHFVTNHVIDNPERVMSKELNLPTPGKYRVNELTRATPCDSCEEIQEVELIEFNKNNCFRRVCQACFTRYNIAENLGSNAAMPPGCQRPHNGLPPCPKPKAPSKYTASGDLKPPVSKASAVARSRAKQQNNADVNAYLEEQEQEADLPRAKKRKLDVWPDEEGSGGDYEVWEEEPLSQPAKKVLSVSSGDEKEAYQLLDEDEIDYEDELGVKEIKKDEPIFEEYEKDEEVWEEEEEYDQGQGKDGGGQEEVQAEKQGEPQGQEEVEDNEWKEWEGEGSEWEKDAPPAPARTEEGRLKPRMEPIFD